MSYKYRGCPCNINNGNPWAISGIYYNVEEQTREGGVLEWCYDRKDAERMLEYMKKFPGFVNLTIDEPEQFKKVGVHPMVKRIHSNEFSK